jgi:pimeloyl-ACP methyl ester carboxylesterase
VTTTPTVIRGVSRLACDAVEQLTNVVEAMHANIAALSPPVGAGTDGRTRGVTGFVYDNIRLVTGAVRVALDQSLALLMSDSGPALPAPRAEAVVSALNGVLGDYLVASANPLAIPMQLRRDGESINVDREALTRALPGAGGRLLLMVHGSCMNDRQWTRNGHDHGAALARDLGYVPLYLLYNSGRHVSENGRELAGLLEALARCWPASLDEVVILAHSMGGLVTRSACHYGSAAGHGWIDRLRKVVFLGTPHHGAPLERGGAWVHTLLGISPYSAPLGRLGAIRSAGVTDLRFGSVLDDDWLGRDRFESDDCRLVVPLPPDVACYFAAATLGRRMRDLNDRLLGDGLVPVESALGRHAEADKNLAIPASRQWIGFSMSHWDLLDRPEVYEQLRRWLAE